MAQGDLYKLAVETRRFLEQKETAFDPEEAARTLIGVKGSPGILSIAVHSRFIGNTKEFKVIASRYNTTEDTLAGWLQKRSWITQRSSDSYEEFAEKVVIAELNKIKGYKGDKTNKPKAGSASAEVSSKKTEAKKQKSPLSIIEILNRKLPDEIRLRMTYPRLVYRTGRFAHSVRVLSLDETKKGGTSIKYTYQKNPYQLFEPGRSYLATPQRNPRTIIDASIRAIASQIMEGRLYTRRV